MLLDIEKYIRQMLPPNLRLPEHIALATTLFSPLNKTIAAQTDYENGSQFDTGTAGQVGVLEFILQSYVHSDIKILDGDGLRFDFRVLIPKGLSQEQVDEAVRLVERYRLRSKRYEVSDLANGSTSVNVSPSEIATTEIAQLTFLGYTFDANTREASIWVNRTGDVKLKIERVDGSPISGSTWNNIPWDNTKWIEGTTEWAAPYSEVFRLNPIGSSGLSPGQEYRLTIANAANNSPIYTQTFTLPTVSQLMPPREIVLKAEPILAACGRGPTVVSIDLVTAAQVVWHFDGDGIEGIKTYLKDTASGSIIRNAVIQVAARDNTNNLKAIFSPGNQPRWTFDTPLPPGSYQLGNEGANCKSVISWSNTFKIEGATPVNPVNPINPVAPLHLDPQLGDYKSYQRLRTFPGLMKLTETPVQGGFSYTDEVISTPPDGYEVSYVINEKRYLGMGRLVNYIHQFPGPLSIRKCFSRVGISSLSVGPNNQPGAGPADTDAVTFMSHGAQYAQIDIVYIKQ